MLTINRIIHPLPALLLLLGAGLVYYPALDSLFLLDDVQNLKDLGEIDARGAGFFLFGSDAGPGGRPLSLLSFALQYQSWPADPFAFKLVNLLLHLGNGVLVYLLCRMVFPFLRLPPAGREIFCLSVSGLWLLHPMQLSTVLYVIQRMTILAALFMLLGMILYLAGRGLYQQGSRRNGCMLAVAGVWLCTLLGILGKETAILLPLYLLVVELVLLPAGAAQRRWRQVTVPALLLPLAGLVFYMIYAYEGLLGAYQIRDFTVGQRLLTEANVLIDYLKLIFIPVTGAFSVFHDDYQIATGLLSPPRTVISILTICLLISLAFINRKKWLVFSFAVFWFFAGHLLESSFIGLELYFEHRNYLPMLGMVIFICWGLLKVSGMIRPGWMRTAVLPFYLLVVLLVTFAEAGLWSNPLLQAHEWTRQHPQSKRAMNHLLNVGLIFDKPDIASAALDKLQDMDHKDIYPVIKEITMRSCFEEEVLTESDWDHYNRRAAVAGFRNPGVVSELQYLVYQITRGHCDTLDLARVADFTDVLLQNPTFHPVQEKLHGLATTFAVLQGDADNALRHVNEALSLQPSVDNMIYKLRILLATGDTDGAAGLLREIKQQLRTMPGKSVFYQDIIRQLEFTLEAMTNDKARNQPGAIIEETAYAGQP